MDGNILILFFTDKKLLVLRMFLHLITHVLLLSVGLAYTQSPEERVSCSPDSVITTTQCQVRSSVGVCDVITLCAEGQRLYI